MTNADPYLANMTDDLKNNMAFVISNWGGDASWLWKDRCSGGCNWPELRLTNLKIRQGGAGPSPAPTRIDPADFDFGGACASASDDLCGSMNCPSANHCRWSWPKHDSAKWDSKDAHCRCDKI